MEFTTHFPCTTCNPASIISHLLLSIIIGTREISGSAITRFRNFTIASLPSIKPSSIFTSMICAPFSTCSRATERASSKFRFFISRRNFFEPATLVRSPTFMKLLSGVIIRGSSPLSFRYFLFSVFIFYYPLCPLCLCGLFFHHRGTESTEFKMANSLNPHFRRKLLFQLFYF